MKALIADDDEINQAILQEILRGQATVECCVDGQTAVARCRSALEDGVPFDLVLLDVMMPDMDGLEALRRIRADEQHRGRARPDATKVIMTTGRSDRETIREAFANLCDAYIVKPIDPEELLNIIGCLFDGCEGCGDALGVQA